MKIQSADGQVVARQDRRARVRHVLGAFGARSEDGVDHRTERDELQEPVEQHASLVNCQTREPGRPNHNRPPPVSLLIACARLPPAAEEDRPLSGPTAPTDVMPGAEPFAFPGSDGPDGRTGVLLMPRVHRHPA